MGFNSGFKGLNVSTIQKVKATSKSHSTEAWGISCCNYIWHYCLLAVRTVIKSGPGSIVGMATGYGLDSPGIDSRWGGEIFRACTDRPWASPSLLYNGYRFLPRGKERPECDADPSLPSSAVVMKE